PGSAPASRAAAATPSILTDMPTLLNLFVRQAIGADGWAVLSITSQLNPSMASQAQAQSGSGQWRVQILDDAQQPLSVEGTLNYVVDVQAQGNLLASASVKVNGALQSANAALSLDLSSE